MTRAARRAIPALLAVLAATLLSLALFAGPATAADDAEESGGLGTTEATEGFGTGQWDGMLLAAGAGLLMGILVFAMSKPGDIHKVDAHHDAPHGDQQMAT